MCDEMPGFGDAWLAKFQHFNTWPSRQNAEILLVRLRYLWRFWFSRTLITYGKNGDGSGFSMKHVSGDFSMKHVGGDFSPSSHEYKKCSFFEF